MTILHYTEYFLFINFLILGSIIAFALLIVNFCLTKFTDSKKAKKHTEREKQSAYECGFEPFEEARVQFNVHYYIVGILFLIFDIEIVYLFPSITLLDSFNPISFFSFIYFLTILTIGFIYEWAIGALAW